MQPRFVVVPAVPKEEESFRVGVRFYAATISVGYDIYDNQEKMRLKRDFPNRSAVELECARMNSQTRNPEERLPMLRTE